jgi:hypothetical protein
VENYTSQPVTDINWDVAGYHKAVLPQGPLCDTTTIAEEPISPDPRGRLYYGPGTQNYDTSVRSPAGGWSQRSAAVTTPGAGDLVSHIQFAYPSSGQYRVAKFSFVSKLVRGPAGPAATTYQYEFSNDAPIPIEASFQIPRNILDFFGRAEMLTVRLAPNNSKRVLPRTDQCPPRIFYLRLAITSEDVAGKALSDSVVSLYVPFCGAP